MCGGGRSTSKSVNQTTQTFLDERIAATDQAVIAREGSRVDRSARFTENTSFVDESVTNITTADPEVAKSAIRAGETLGKDAIRFGDDAVAAAIGTTRDALDSVLKISDAATGRVLDAADRFTNRVVDFSTTARESSEDQDQRRLQMLAAFGVAAIVAVAAWGRGR